MIETGFYHIDKGYWQTTGTVPDHILANYPSGTVEVPLRPSAGHDWDGAAWVYTDPLTLDEHKELALALDQVKASHAEMLSSLTENPTSEERDTWAVKDAAARAHIAANASPNQTSMLTEEATRTGETLDALAARIVAKADRYYTLAGIAAGLRRATVLAIEASADAAAIEAVMVNHETQRETEIALFIAG